MIEYIKGVATELTPTYAVIEADWLSDEYISADIRRNPTDKRRVENACP